MKDIKTYLDEAKIDESSEDKLRQKTAKAMMKMLDKHIDSIEKIEKEIKANINRIESLGLDDSAKTSYAMLKKIEKDILRGTEDAAISISSLVNRIDGYHL